MMTNLRKTSPLLFFCFTIFLFTSPQWISRTQGELLIGVFDAQNGHGMTQSLAMDKWQGKPNAIQTVFTTFDESEMTWLWTGVQSIWEDGHKIPMITWEPKYWQQWSPTDITARVARGDLDTYIKSWGKSLKTYIAGPDGVLGTADDRRAFLRFAHEMNGNWYPWSAVKGQTAPSDYINMWRHVYQLFASNGLPRDKVSNSLLWVWSPIDFDVGDFKMDDYYPGDSFVDWVGLTGFNWGTSEGWSGWWSPKQLWEDAISRVRAIGGGKKPVGITEYASVPNGGDKSGWLDDFFDLILANDIRMACYFNLDKFEQSGTKYWSIFGGGGDTDFWDTASSVDYKGWAAYKSNVNNKKVIGSDYNNPRVLTDDAFKGFPSQLAKPSPVPSQKQKPAVRDASTSSREEELPVTSSEDQLESPAGTSSLEEDKGESHLQETKKPTSKVLAVFNDEFGSRYDFLSWGSPKTITNPNFVPVAGSSLKAPEGKSFLKVQSTQWGGCGVFTRAAASVNVSGFKTLKFSIANTEDVTIQLQDVNGIKWSRVVKGAKDMSWRTVSLPLAHQASDDSAFDATKVTGLFLATTYLDSDFYIDSVIYKK